MSKVTTVAGSLSSGAWRLSEGLREKTYSNDTTGISVDGRLMVQGRLIQESQGRYQVVVTIDPAAVDRKLAIRKLNDQLEGRSPQSNTDVKIRR
jgi:hypothetical protein